MVGFIVTRTEAAPQGMARQGTPPRCLLCVAVFRAKGAMSLYQQRKGVKPGGGPTSARDVPQEVGHLREALRQV